LIAKHRKKIEMVVRDNRVFGHGSEGIASRMAHLVLSATAYFSGSGYI
jgi:hypothetical protein